MQIKVPEYFSEFKCIANKCIDSCCIGWEIVIDDATRTKYKHLDSDIGREIADKTQHGCFHLDENGRCAFLDTDGLCRIISGLGEGYLCDICREHPRYYGTSKCGIEGGLGLGCEEAARIILSLKALPRFTTVGRDVHYFDEDSFGDVSEHFRNNLYEGIFNLDVCTLIGKYIACATAADEVAFEVCTAEKRVPIPKVTYAQADENEIKRISDSLLPLLLECEALTDDWRDIVEKAGKVCVSDVLRHEEMIRSLLFYFTHRYVREGVEDMTLGARIMFSTACALSVTAICEIIEDSEPEVRAAVLFSKNIEYSTENVDMILDRLCDIL